MTILSQIGIIIIIGFIIVVLVRSNKLTEEAAREGEHFTDEWQDYQNRKKELKEEKRAVKEIKAEKKKLRKKKKPMEEVEEEEPVKNSSLPNPEETGRMDTEEVESTKAEEILRPSEKEMVQPSEEKFIQPAGDVSSPSRKITLVKMDDNHVPVEWVVVNQLPFTIGRGKQNSLVLDDLCVAREHCQITEVSGRFFLKDQGTANKIYTDGRIYEEVELYDRQRFYLGNEEILVKIEESGAPSLSQYGGGML